MFRVLNVKTIEELREELKQYRGKDCTAKLLFDGEYFSPDKPIPFDQELLDEARQSDGSSKVMVEDIKEHDDMVNYYLDFPLMDFKEGLEKLSDAYARELGSVLEMVRRLSNSDNPKLTSKYSMIKIQIEKLIDLIENERIGVSEILMKEKLIRSLI